MVFPPGVLRSVGVLRFEPAPAQLDTVSAAFVLQLKPGEWRRIAIRAACVPAASPYWGVRNYYRALLALRREHRATSNRGASLDGSNPVFGELAGRSLADLYMLMSDTEYGPYPFAGIPWFSTPFGRDGIITALFTLWLDPTIAKGVLRFLAAT